MSWTRQLKGDSLAWLLEDNEPGMCYLVLRDLLDYPAEDADLRAARAAAHRAGPIAEVLDVMDSAGFWVKPGAGYNPKYTGTVWSIILLAQLGARVEEDGRIASACAYLLDHALAPGGQFSMSGAPSGTVDCLQGNLCWALLELGFEDARLEKALEWMARTVTGEGIAPLAAKQAPVRYYAGKCGPGFACGANDSKACAWGAVKVMLALSKISTERRSPLQQRAVEHGVDFLLGVDPLSAAYPCGYSEKPSANWWKPGFPVFYVTDLLQVAEALAALGRIHDPRAASLLEWIRGKQDEGGRWALEYDYSGKTWGYFGVKKQPNPWVTLRALRVLKAAGED